MATNSQPAKPVSKLRVLSIDGGGIRGIIPATILVYLEKKIRDITKNGEAKLGEYFDMIAGTSTGGILSCIYLMPDSPGSIKARYDAVAAQKLYLDHGRSIFGKNFWKQIKHFQLWDEQYPADNLQLQLEKYFGDTNLSELIRPCLITSYDFYKRRATFFNSTTARAKGGVRDFKVKHITRATSAAPTYFEPARIESLNGGTFNLIDGGVFVNNPAMCTYSEARGTEFSKDDYIQRSCSSGKPDRPTAAEMFHVSIGTGSEAKRIEFDKLRNAGIIGWLPVLIDIMMSANSETVDYHLRKIYDTLDNEDKQDYVRLDPSRGEAAAEMDCVSVKNLKALKAAGEDFIFQHQDRLDHIAEKLVKYC